MIWLTVQTSTFVNKYIYLENTLEMPSSNLPIGFSITFKKKIAFHSQEGMLYGYGRTNPNLLQVGFHWTNCMYLYKYTHM